MDGDFDKLERFQSDLSVLQSCIRRKLLLNRGSSQAIPRYATARDTKPADLDEFDSVVMLHIPFSQQKLMRKEIMRRRPKWDTTITPVERKLPLSIRTAEAKMPPLPSQPPPAIPSPRPFQAAQLTVLPDISIIKQRPLEIHAPHPPPSGTHFSDLMLRPFALGVDFVERFEFAKLGNPWRESNLPEPWERAKARGGGNSQELMSLLESKTIPHSPQTPRVAHMIVTYGSKLKPAPPMRQQSPRRKSNSRRWKMVRPPMKESTSIFNPPTNPDDPPDLNLLSAPSLPISPPQTWLWSSKTNRTIPSRTSREEKEKGKGREGKGSKKGEKVTSGKVGGIGRGRVASVSDSDSDEDEASVSISATLLSAVVARRFYNSHFLLEMQAAFVLESALRRAVAESTMKIRRKYIFAGSVYLRMIPLFRHYHQTLSENALLTLSAALRRVLAARKVQLIRAVTTLGPYLLRAPPRAEFRRSYRDKKRNDKLSKKRAHAVKFLSRFFMRGIPRRNFANAINARSLLQSCVLRRWLSQMYRSAKYPMFKSGQSPEIGSLISAESPRALEAHLRFVLSGLPVLMLERTVTKKKLVEYSAVVLAQEEARARRLNCDLVIVPALIVSWRAFGRERYCQVFSDFLDDVKNLEKILVRKGREVSAPRRASLASPRSAHSDASSLISTSQKHSSKTSSKIPKPGKK